ncbi:ribosome silencing factor [Hyalangium rubrum]|uniref:Ribosomal silencing factor RsfS n=1 Tax=Hyalangium rubrum TaxID=3103134 RepID=A0ABU5GZS2_9BACT|nr:ribosome silencing factor [Hyalangium sp. s54d21]MDY7226697.1 ribosome silencing factor [Hyalangium sp. s54d21]
MALKKKKTSSPKAKSGAKKATGARKAPAAKKPAARKKTSPLKPPRRKKALLKAAPEVEAPAENPQAKALAHKVARLLLDKKATEVLVLDVRGMASYADYIVLASGESDRQVSAMAESVRTKVKEEDALHPTGTEGWETGQWVLLDYGEVVAHLFLAETRAFYDLEGLWADAPREKLA